MESHWDMKLKSAVGMCCFLWKTAGYLIPPNVHSHPKQFEKTMRGVCSLRAEHKAARDPCDASQRARSASTLQRHNLIKNVLTTLWYSSRFLHIDTITPLLWASMLRQPSFHQDVDSVVMTISPGDCCCVTPWRQASCNNRDREADVWDRTTWSPPYFTLSGK